MNTPSHTLKRKLQFERLETRCMLATTVAGDYSANGLVDAADYVIWRAALDHTVVTPGDGADGNRDLIVGPQDYQVWRANYGVLAGDYNESNVVDAADYVLWRSSPLGSAAMTSTSSNSALARSPDDYNIWKANFGHQGTGQTSLNWFDANIHDAALRTLGHNLYLDGLIDRADMLAIFSDVQDGGAVDTVELADLQAITNNSSLFGTSQYVDALSTYVVFGNTANAHYQGQALGNLAAGSSASQLQQLVNKWFLGLDRPATSSTYAPVSGSLFVDGPSYRDINQGGVGDCYILAALAETALKSPATITDMFIANGDGTYTVKFYNGAEAEYITVDSDLPIDATGHLFYAGRGKLYNDPANELWVSLAEKAYAQINEMGWLRTYLMGNGQNTYAAIDGGYFYTAVGQTTGRATVAFTTTLVATNFSTFVDAYNQGALIGFTTMKSPPNPAVVSNHVYAVLSYDAATQTITLFNPWGIQVDPLVMSWSEIQANFSYFDRTT